MRSKRVVMVVSGLMFFIAAAMIYQATHPKPPRLDKKPHEALGWGMAQETLKLLQPGGEITIITRDTSVFENPALDVRLASFKKAVKKAGAKIGTVHALQVDPLRPTEVPPGDFLELIRNAPKGSVIASFLGPPLLSAAQRAELKTIEPAIVAVCSSGAQEVVDLHWLFDQGLLHSAILDRPHPLTSGSRPNSLRAWFERHYVTIAPSQFPKGGRNASR